MSLVNVSLCLPVPFTHSTKGFSWTAAEIGSLLHGVPFFFCGPLLSTIDSQVINKKIYIVYYSGTVSNPDAVLQMMPKTRVDQMSHVSQSQEERILVGYIHAYIIHTWGRV